MEVPGLRLYQIYTHRRSIFYKIELVEFDLKQMEASMESYT